MLLKHRAHEERDRMMPKIAGDVPYANAAIGIRIVFPRGSFRSSGARERPSNADMSSKYRFAIDIVVRVEPIQKPAERLLSCCRSNLDRTKHPTFGFVELPVADE